MIELKSAENLAIVLTFIVPGLIITYIRSQFITGRRPSHTDSILTYVVLSLIYYIPTVIFIENIRGDFDTWQGRAAWIALTLVGPAVIGFLLGVVAKLEFWPRLLACVGLNVVHIIPAAWDWRFSRTPPGGMFVMVTLTSGERVAGWFGTSSFASSDSGERDIYIEEEYQVSKKGRWNRRSERVGILIPLREIRYVEFWNT